MPELESPEESDAPAVWDSLTELPGRSRRTGSSKGSMVSSSEGSKSSDGLFSELGWDGEGVVAFSFFCGISLGFKCIAVACEGNIARVPRAESNICALWNYFDVVDKWKGMEAASFTEFSALPALV